uniref:Clathrin/coatomer adaptor adaptin-like N-terminal domain-containing protein n=1 Tax=Plectus sambesii TaxID=2011161 RepID=A0A914WGF4_9BILA
MESEFGEKLARLFGQLSKQHSVPHHFDDTFFDKLLDYLPSDDQTNRAIAAFVDRVTTADACNLLVVRLCLRLCGYLVQKNSSIVDRLPMEELLSKSQLVMHHDPGAREAFFNTSTHLLVARQRVHNPTTQLALKSLRDAGESVFVRKSAQQYLSAYLRATNDHTTKDHTTESALFDQLMQLPESAVLINSAAAAVVEGGVGVPQQMCESFVRVARTRRRAVGDAYWRLTANAISRMGAEEAQHRLLRDASGWANELGRLAVLKHFLLLSRSTSGVVSQTTIDLLLQAVPSPSAIFHLTDVVSILENHQLLFVVNKLIEKFAAAENAPVMGLTKFVSQLPASVFADNGLDINSLLKVVRRHCWAAPDLLRIVIESTPFARIKTSLLELDSLVSIAVAKLDDPEWEVRDSALEVLTHISEAYRRSDDGIAAVPTDLSAIVGKVTSLALNDPSHFARASAVRLLESVDPAQALPTALQIATDDSDPLPRRAAVHLMRSQCAHSESASSIGATLPRLALDTDVEVLIATIELCTLLIEHRHEADKALAFLIEMIQDTDVTLAALDALKKLTIDGRLSGDMLSTIDEAEMFRKRELNRDHYAVQPDSLLDDMFAALCKDDSVDDDENMKDCY